MYLNSLFIESKVFCFVSFDQLSKQVKDFVYFDARHEIKFLNGLYWLCSEIFPFAQKCKLKQLGFQYQLFFRIAPNTLNAWETSFIQRTLHIVGSNWLWSFYFGGANQLDSTTKSGITKEFFIFCKFTYRAGLQNMDTISEKNVSLKNSQV